ncbi:hypothetical protein B6R96_34495 [Streptomyces sp. Sge12]|uniref:DUF3618 domain-containing protein n=1 Tax=Streptomyces sp. Sge12 TaxID=1972846 RepID=UPI0009C22B22|nr:DUF3618 domain-containing protein [Streptomyces sp. Sge12]ARE78419.1 hypothetical protein B6R96_34495 [Streptomyces sp. Sge12]
MSSDEPTPEALRAQIEQTRDELGRTVEALAAKADVKAQAREKTAAVKAQAAEKAAHVTGQIRDRAEHAAHLASEKTHAATARDNRTTALVAVAGAALLVFLLVRQVRHTRGQK